MHGDQELDIPEGSALPVDVSGACSQSSTPSDLCPPFQERLPLRHGPLVLHLPGNVRHRPVLSGLPRNGAHEALHVRLLLPGPVDRHNSDREPKTGSRGRICLHHPVLRAWTFCDTERQLHLSIAARRLVGGVKVNNSCVTQRRLCGEE